MKACIEVLSSFSAAATVMNALYDARLQWENGAYRTSNEELYNILDKCLVLFNELTAERALIKELNTLLEARGNKPTNGTSLATKVVRYVFDGCSAERSYTYARVSFCLIRAAASLLVLVVIVFAFRFVSERQDCRSRQRSSYGSEDQTALTPKGRGEP